jgi:hypothetical protein
VIFSIYGLDGSVTSKVQEHNDLTCASSLRQKKTCLKCALLPFPTISTFPCAPRAVEPLAPHAHCSH